MFNQIMRWPLMRVAVLYCMLVFVSCKKTKPTAQPFPSKVVGAVACDVCKELVAQTYEATMAMRKNASRTRDVEEVDILTEVVEQACNPFAKQGQWLRFLDITVVGKDRQVRLDFRSEPGKCKRDCTTVVEACLLTLDNEGGDSLPVMLLKDKPIKAIKATVCEPVCEHGGAKKVTEDMARQISADQWEEIQSKEMEIEALMDNMERSHVPGMPRMDVYDREEMLRMRQSIETGDYDTLTSIDPTANNLSPEEFDELRSMYAADGDEAA